MFSETPLVRKRLARGRLVKFIFGLMATAMIVPLVLVVVYLVVEAWPVLTWQFVSEMPRNGLKEGGILSAILGTFYLVAVSLCVSAPIGILAAVYLNEYASDNWFTRIVNLGVVNLAGVPSIVHALFGYGAILYITGEPCILAAAITLGIMTMPVIIASTKQALAAVPMAFREACWNVGASRWQTLRTVVLPNSGSGILTGLILEVSRAAGETAPILFTGAVFYKRTLPRGLTDQTMALSYQLFSVTTQGGQVPEERLYGTAVVLLTLVLFMNSASIALRMHFRSRKKW